MVTECTYVFISLYAYTSYMTICISYVLYVYNMCKFVCIYIYVYDIYR